MSKHELEIMGNFGLDVRACTKGSFIRAIAIACAASPGGKVSHWSQSPKYGLVLFWSKGESPTFDGQPIVPLPFEMDAEQTADFAWQWLEKADRTQFKLKGWDVKYQGGDVDADHAWRIFVEGWGHVGGSPYAVAAILPCWAWIGK